MTITNITLPEPVQGVICDVEVGTPAAIQLTVPAGTYSVVEVDPQGWAYLDVPGVPDFFVAIDAEWMRP
jgi:hypothetical protein